MDCNLLSNDGWPNDIQRLLLRAALLEGDEAVEAWRRWRAGQRIDNLDRGSLFILPSVYLNLQRKNLNDPALDLARKIYQQTWARNQRAKHGLLEMAEILTRADIPFIVLKGMPLVLFYYENMGARRMEDIDVLINMPDLPAAADALSHYRWVTEGPLPSPSVVPFLHAAHFYHPKWGCLDLHWRPFRVDSPGVAEKRFWQRAIQHQINGIPIKAPDPVDLLIQTGFHCRKLDTQSNCRWLIDAVTLIRKVGPAIDWSVLLERTVEADLLLPVRDALTYLHHEFNAIVPEQVLRQFWNLPAADEDMIKYQELMLSSIRGSKIPKVIISQWRRYAGVRKSMGKTVNPVMFIKYYWLYLQWWWEVRHWWQVPLVAPIRVVRRSGHRGG